MAVKSKLTGPLLPVGGVRIAAVRAGIRYPDRLDLVLFELAEGARTAAVFTRNAFCAAPVVVARNNLAQGPGRFLLINTGNANAGTGKAGIEAALTCCKGVADVATERQGTAVRSDTVLPFSTGVIGEPLPVNKILAALPEAFGALGSADWHDASRGIMTTDTRPKAVSVSLALAGNPVTITGIAKGAGMIKPDMATMLAFVFTDAKIETELLQEMLNDAVAVSFNRITVDGDTSTNDSCVLVATGASGCRLAAEQETDCADFRAALADLFQQLATEIIRDAEGASKFVTVKVINGASSRECLDVAYAVAESPLVKTALFASDPNWGRILAAVGRAGLIDLDLEAITIDLGTTRLVENGGLADGYTEEKGQQEMDREEITVTIDLARGSAVETVWTSDLSLDYVRINAEYRS